MNSDVFGSQQHKISSLNLLPLNNNGICRHAISTSVNITINAMIMREIAAEVVEVCLKN